MKTVVLHGDNVSLLESKLQEIEGRFVEARIVRASGKEITNEFVLNNFRGSELFDEKKLIILRNPEKDFDVGSLSGGERVSLVVIFDKELSKSSEWLKIGKTVNFSLPQDKSIFSFLDQVLESDPKALGSLGDLVDEFGFQYVLTMLFYNFRRLFLHKKLPPFVEKKLEQKKKVWCGRMADCYEQLLETDYNFKNGLGDGRSAIFLVVSKMMQFGEAKGRDFGPR